MEKHILLIDDDADEPEIFISALREAKILFRCTWANGADEGLMHLQTIIPDLIVLDFNMPKINGLELLRTLKNSAALAMIPVIMYSATMDKELAAKAMQTGAMACIRKPYNMQELPVLLKPFL
jgi:CheY-like chemotaxis protein